MNREGWMVRRLLNIFTLSQNLHRNAWNMTGFAVQSCYDDDDSNDSTMNQQIGSIWSTCQHERSQAMSPSSSSLGKTPDWQNLVTSRTVIKVILINENCVWESTIYLSTPANVTGAYSAWSGHACGSAEILTSQHCYFSRTPPSL